MDRWTKSRLGDVCEVIKGRKPKLHAQQGPGYLPYLVAKVMRGSQEPEFASVTDRNSVAVTADETIIICDGSNSGEVFYGFDGILSSTMGKIAKKAPIDDGYLRAFLHSTFEVFNGSKTGAAIPHLDKEAMYALEFSYPDIHEQRRIVEILDDAFEAIGVAKGNAEKSLQNAQGVFESFQSTMLAGQRPDWKTVSVASLVDDGILVKPQDGNHGEIHPTKADFVEEGIPFIMAADLIDGGVDTQNCRFISEKQARSLRIGFAKTGDVLLSHKGTIGRAAILTTDCDFVILTPQVTYYRTKDLNRLDRTYLYYYFLSSSFQSDLNREAAGGATRAYIGITRQLDLKIVVPPIHVQRELARRFMDAEEGKSRLETALVQKIAALDELKKSLLHHAFTGQLTSKKTDQLVGAMA